MRSRENEGEKPRGRKREGKNNRGKTGTAGDPPLELNPVTRNCAGGAVEAVTEARRVRVAAP